ncbi:predicted protein [Arabidopsis lyrata subsp. lyrata]|uniref:Predicted protein n=1 Tax=Arabidopsis lyrata subsp. lyrata TaxID=81972 RepID=D7MBS1_ARALL|nr:predicted protein [Arabidopsis lyrata subsp. lyrata]
MEQIEVRLVGFPSQPCPILITASHRRFSHSLLFSQKILEFVEQSKGWSAIDSSRKSAEDVMFSISEEELYNIPTADYAHRTRCYLHSEDFENGLKLFEDYMSADKIPAMEFYTTPIEGPMTGHTDNGMKIAQDTLVMFIGSSCTEKRIDEVKMNERNFFLDPRTGSNLLLKAAGEKTGGYIVANMIWDLMLVRNILPTLAAVEAYYKGLKEREIPEDDPIEFKE